MGSDSFMMLFDVIIFCYGVYMVYSAYQMRRTEQPPTMLINPMELVGARDVKGFCEAMFRPFVVFGMMASIYGLLGLVNDFFISLPALNFGAIILFLVMCYWFFREMKKNKSKYLK
ncbi:hypothetical protein AALB53_00225 [Lachnospiraceae bacterium 47-T17]